MKKILIVFFLILIVTYVYYKLLLQEAIFLYHSNENWKFPVIILLLTLVLLISLIIDLSYSKRFTRYYLTPFCVFTFVSQEYTLWPGEILLNKNYLVIGVITTAFLIIFSLIIYRSDREFKWLDILQKPLKEYLDGTRWKKSNILERGIMIIMTAVALNFALWAPYSTILTIGYLGNKEKCRKTAKLMGYGMVSSKYYSHRYWEIELDGKREMLMIYAAVSSEDVNQCTANFAPEIGSTLLIEGRTGVFGFSFDKVVLIKDQTGRITCK